ncbi:MAG: ATP-binding protein [Alcanivoracaceae bacterium]|nr:ATP-binding protein [Alcanivoracaceae bacterium]
MSSNPSSGIDPQSETQRTGALPALVRHWMAWLLSDRTLWLKNHCRHTKEFEHPELLQPLGIEDESSLKGRRPPLELMAHVLEDNELEAAFEDDLVYQNAGHLSQHLALDEAARRLVTFLVHLNSCSPLSETAELLRDVTLRSAATMLGGLLEVPGDAVLSHIRPGSALRATGILLTSVRAFSCNSLGDAASLDDNIQQLLLLPDVRSADIVRQFFRESPGPELALEDYQHLGPQVQRLTTLLRHSLSDRISGVNILLYGPPGTGKTQLARLLAQELGVTLAEITALDEDNDTLSSDQRIRRLLACQRILSNESDAIVLFDEAEETLTSGLGSGLLFSPRQVQKGVLVQTLEQNPHPTVWISNDVDMDPALLRRFTHVMALDVPAEPQRRQIIDRTLGEQPVSEAMRQSLARHEHLPAALVASAGNFAAMTASNHEDHDSLVMDDLNARLDALGNLPPVRPPSHNPLPWRPECIEADHDMAALLKEIRPNAEVRLCLHGAPGTGKTAWARALSSQLGRPLMVRQAADLLSMWVGQAEKEIAAMFRRAEAQQAVLVIDEADTFLFDRGQALRSWEISQVNQFLSSMENYRGIFVATTNLLSQVDAAAMRRFDFHVRFDYLPTRKSLQLLEDVCSHHGVELPGEDTTSAMLAGLPPLAPGDFTALHRHLMIRKDALPLTGVIEILQSHTAYRADTSGSDSESPGKRPAMH